MDKNLNEKNKLFIIPPDYDEGPECEDDGCDYCGDIHCDGSCIEEDN